MQPIVIQDTIAIAANSVNNNVIATNPSLIALRRLPFPAKITFAITQGATGISFDLDVGSSNVVANSNARVVATSPQIPLDVVNSEAYGDEGDLLTLKAANTTGASITIRYMMIAEPLVEAQGQRVQLPPNTLVMVQGPINVPNTTTDQQLLNGLKYERAPVPCIVDFLMTQSAAGLLRTIYVDSERIAPPSAISLANQIPQDPFDTTVMGVQVDQDAEINLSVSNFSGNALNVFWKVVMRQLVRA